MWKIKKERKYTCREDSRSWKSKLDTTSPRSCSIAGVNINSTEQSGSSFTMLCCIMNASLVSGFQAFQRIQLADILYSCIHILIRNIMCIKYICIRFSFGAIMLEWTRNCAEGQSNIYQLLSLFSIHAETNCTEHQTSMRVEGEDAWGTDGITFMNRGIKLSGSNHTQHFPFNNLFNTNVNAIRLPGTPDATGV